MAGKLSKISGAIGADELVDDITFTDVLILTGVLSEPLTVKLSAAFYPNQDLTIPTISDPSYIGFPQSAGIISAFKSIPF
ncbi:hypothetical protein [Leptolyngbya sp. 'hensonii']|uniref:hypothetical protein n=1 Tax=Leptolyngbya sp. 'hensonii' TaxID=1922337 RepID=UPI0015C580C7|nr:hypothetical protein [Leptolyngbya sp. 'hensonii']